jgi:hypothetical protein
LPQKFKETQVEWFEKKGICNHIDCIFYIDDQDEITKVSYVTLAENSIQDGYSVLCIFKHVLQQIDFPKMTKIFDNAACYSLANVISGKAAISKKMGVNLIRNEFNEPQRGKDQCGRDSGVITTRIKSFPNSGISFS